MNDTLSVQRIVNRMQFLMLSQDGSSISSGVTQLYLGGKVES